MNKLLYIYISISFPYHYCRQDTEAGLHLIVFIYFLWRGALLVLFNENIMSKNILSFNVLLNYILYTILKKIADC